MSANSETQHAIDAVVRVALLTKHLHARPAGQIAQLAARHQQNTIELSAGQRRANARSVLAVMSLGAVSGSEIRVEVAGPDADAVADQVVQILLSPEIDG
jgi:phosphotransferase system HPr (HPr) family protein